MAITFSDLHKVATQLHAGEGEASQRSGVSRNYYAAFHAAVHWLESTPGMPSEGQSSGGVHEQLQGRLRNLDRQAGGAQKLRGRKLAAQLQQLKARRVTADYMLQETMSKKEIDMQRMDTAAFLLECEAALPSTLTG